jgi:hypothetical protein
MKAVLFGIAFCLMGAAASADVRMTMQNGRVSIVAKDATVRQILTEWARVGQTKIVNVERIPGGPITIELTNVSEAQALDVLLRALSGYITALRPVEANNLSQFDRIIIMPTVASVRPAPSSSPPPPVFQQAPQFNQQPIVGDDEPDDQRPSPAASVPPNRGPVFNTFPQPQVLNPQPGAPSAFPGQQPQPIGGMPQQGAAPQAPVNSAVPTAPYGGVAVPGMVAPAPPPQPGQLLPGQIQPAQPIRRPGGNQ